MYTKGVFGGISGETKNREFSFGVLTTLSLNFADSVKSILATIAAL